MNFSRKLALSVVAACAAASAASAQDAGPAAPPPAEAAPAPAANYSDAEVQSFASAIIAVNKIQGDATLAEADKQPRMLEAVQQAGLDPQKFNEISQAAQADTALQQRIQTAVSASQPQEAAPPQN